MPIFGQHTITCPVCGQEIDKDARFCPYCGTPTNARMGKCPYCGKKVNLDAKYCSECGRELGTQRDPVIRDRVWRASLDDFAVRLDPDDIDGRIYKDIEIQMGQEGIILVDGRAEQERRGPGTYTVQSFFDRFLSLGRGRRVRALIVQGGPMLVRFDLKELRTKDGFKVNSHCEVAVAISNAATFFAHVMRQQKAFTITDLRRLLFNQVRDAVQEYIRTLNLQQLASDMAMKENIATAVERHLSRTLEDSGLSIREVRVAEFVHPRYNAVLGVQEEIRLRREEVEADITLTKEEKEAELRKRQALFEVASATEDQETVELGDKARIFEERAQVWERMRRAMSSEKANEIRSEQDFADFLAEIDKRKVLRQEELDILKEEFANRKEDRHAARAQIAYLAGLERDYERKRAELAQRTDFTLEEMAASLKIEQQKLVDAGLMDETRWANEQAELLREAERADWKRSEQIKWDEFERARESAADRHRRELQKAKVLHALEIDAIVTDAELTDAEKRARKDVELARYKLQKREIEREIEQADFDERLRQRKLQEQQEQEEILDDVEIARRLQEMMAEHKRNKEQIRLDAEQRAREIARQDDLERQEAALKAELARKQAELDAQKLQQQHELAMLQARAEMSAEALMSLSSPEQARIIAELKTTEALQGMSDDAIYAMMAKDSAPLAAALAEKFKALQAQPDLAEKQLAEVKKLYDQMVVDLQKDKERQAELNERAQRRLQEMYEKGLDSQRDGMVDIARATSHPPQTPQSPNIVVVPSGGSNPQVIQTGGGNVDPATGSSKVQICPQCHLEMPVGTKYCTNCGYQFH